MSGAPIGELFKAEIDGQERSYQILPRVFSSATMEALGRMTRSAARELLSDNLKVAAEIRKVDDTVYRDFMRDVTAACTSKIFTGYESALEALGTREGLVIALMHNCVECKDNRQEAEKLVDSCPNVIELMASVISSGNEALEAAKNSLTPESEGENTETETVPE